MSTFAELHRRLQKPARGAHRLQLRAKVDARKAEELANKRVAKRRDGGRCRWPGRTCCSGKWALESAHFKAKGSGGDHGRRSRVEDLITFCGLRHQGARSLHSGHCKVEPLTSQGMSGPVAFYERDRVPGRWRLIARERSIGLLES